MENKAESLKRLPRVTPKLRKLDKQRGDCSVRELCLQRTIENRAKRQAEREAL